MIKCGHKIPEDILNEIILYVPGYQNIYKVSLCCKKYSELLNFELYKLFIQAFSKNFGSRLGQQVFNNDNSTHFSVTHIRKTKPEILKVKIAHPNHSIISPK